MGMFDYVNIDPDLLPITDEQKRGCERNSYFQSKDWECKLSTLTITESRELEYEDFDYAWNKKEERLIRENVKTVKLNLPILNFYASIGKEWFEFLAYFTDGKLDRIERIPAPWD